MFRRTAIEVNATNNLMRALLVASALTFWQCAVHAAGCVPATEERKSEEPLVDWYDNYIRPYRPAAAGAGAARINKSQVEAFIDEIGAFNRRAVLDQLMFEPLVELVMAGYARAPDFKGIDTAAVEKLYKSGTAQKLDFSLLCIDARSVHTPNDAFGITLFGVVVDDCQHIGMQGLVFTAALVNGGANGQCKPDQLYRKMYVVPLPAGTNEITYVCGKDQRGCARQ
jgi:hypothetical protein